MLSPVQKNVIRSTLLILVLVALLALLFSRQDERAAQQQANRDVKVAAEIRQLGYDDPARRAARPLEYPDYGDGPVFLLTGNYRELSEDLYEEASQASGKVKAFKIKRAGKTLNQPVDLALIKQVVAPRDFLQKYHKFRLRELEAYQQLTKDNPDVKSAGEEFLKAYLFRVTGQPDSLSDDEIILLAKKVIELQSNDPLLLTYVTYVLYEETGDSDAALSMWTQCLEQLRTSQYPQIIQVYLRLFVVDFSSSVSKGHKDALLVSIVRWLEEASTEQQWLDCVHFKLAGIWEVNDITFRDGLVVGCLKSEKIEPFIKHWLTGQRLLDQAWGERRGRYASNMSRGDQLTFQKGIQMGKAHLEYACLLRPDSPHPPIRLISVAMTGHDRVYEPVDWFRRSVENHYDRSLPYYALWNSMLPRWGGDLGQFRSFAGHCINSDRFDTQLPYYAFEVMIYLQDNEFIDDWSQQKKFGAKTIIDHFLTQREKYRAAHPDEKLYGDTPYYRTRIGLFLQRAGYPELALAEFKAAEGDLDYSQLQKAHRPGKFLMCRLFAAQGEVEDRVLEFDQKIRKGWTADAKLSEIDALEKEWQALKPTAQGELAERYYAHTGKMLQQLRAYLKGDWVEFDFEDRGLGWEISADQIDWDNADQSLLVCRKTNEAQHSWARPLITVEAPLRIQAQIEQIAAHPGDTHIGIRWEELYGKTDEEGEKIPSLNVGIRGYWSYPKAEVKGPNPFHRLEDLHAGFRIYTVDRVPYRHQEQSIRVMDPGMHLIDWKLNADSSEVTLGNYPDQVRFDDTAPLRNHLLFKIESKSKAVRLPNPPGIVWKLKNVRLKRLPASDLPAAETPLAERVAYWEKRVQQESDDVVPRLKLCEVYWEQGQADRLLELSTETLAKWPGMEKIQQYQGLALYGLRRYPEALAALELAMKEYRENVDVIMAAAEIQSAINDPALRNPEEALKLALFGKRISINYRVEYQAIHWANLAVAYAANGNFEEAMKANQEAIALAADDLKTEFESRQKLYEASQPYHYPTEN